MAVRATRLRRLRIRQTVRVGTLVSIAAVASLSYLAISKQVTLVVDGRPEAIRTMSGNVGDLLAGEGIAVSPYISVEPPPATELSDGMTVVVDSPLSSIDELRARLTAPSTDPGVGVWVVDGTSVSWSKIASQLVEGTPSASGDGFASATAVRAVVMGKVHDVITNAATAGELLSAMGITPDADDRVQPSPSTPLHVGEQIRFDRVRIFTKGVTAAIPFGTGTTYSSQLDPGTVQIARSGVDGVLRTIFRIRVVNGEIVARTVLGRQVLQQAIAQRRVVGRSTGTVGTQVGQASWYDTPWTGLTAAHPWLPFGTRVTVTNLANGESVTVVINDRGPFGGRVIDLSPEAFQALGIPLSQGVCQVRLSW